MKATLEFVIGAFDRFNAMCFGNRLPQPDRFVISSARSFLGRLEYKNRYSSTGRLVHYDYSFKISGVVEMSEQMIEDVVIHEMIHLYIATQNLKDTSTHGKLFRREMERINTTFGRHIAISHYASQSPERQPTGQYRVVCVTALRNGILGVTVCAKSRVFKIRYEILHRFNVVSMDWYYSCDDFFAGFTRVTSGRVFQVTREELDAHLKGAIPLVCDEYSLRPK